MAAQKEYCGSSNTKLVALFHELQNALLGKRTLKPSKQYRLKVAMTQESNANTSNTPTKGAVPAADGKRILADFMHAAGEPLTWIESHELWNDLLETNNSKLPNLENTVHSLIHSKHRVAEDSFSFPILPCILEGDGYYDTDTSSNIDTHSTLEFRNSELSKNEIEDEVPLQQGQQRDKTTEAHVELPPLVLNNNHDLEGNVEDVLIPDEALVNVARGIKNIYGIRLSNDKSELKYIAFALLFLWLTVLILIIVAHFYPSASIGSLTWEVLIEAIALFIAEIAWEFVLSAIVIKYKIKINYTRKLGNLFKIPRYFAADLLPFYESTATSLVTALAINQTLFCIMYSRQAREKVPFFSYVFLSQDRREDRPDTLIFQVTEDIMRFGVYFPYKILVANRIGLPELVFIPVIVNNIGDGLAEPVGVAFGKHKYSTTALYHKGKFSRASLRGVTKVAHVCTSPHWS